MRRRVLGLAGPVIGENFLETLLGIVDTWLVAGLGAVAMAGVGSALQVMFFLIAALSALAVGSAVLVAQAVGAGDLLRASRLGRQSLIWSVMFSIPLALGGWLLSGPIIGMFGLEPEVAAIGTQYLQVTMGTVVVLVALFIGGGVLRGAGDSRTPHAGDRAGQSGQCRAGLWADLRPLWPARAWRRSAAPGRPSWRARWRWRCCSARCGAGAMA